ncbi:hypothetical protein V3C33_04970 [Micrococcaceae bacterium Sec5.7]
MELEGQSSIDDLLDTPSVRAVTTVAAADALRVSKTEREEPASAAQEPPLKCENTAILG